MPKGSVELKESNDAKYCRVGSQTTRTARTQRIQEDQRPKSPKDSKHSCFIFLDTGKTKCDSPRTQMKDSTELKELKHLKNSGKSRESRLKIRIIRLGILT